MANGLTANGAHIISARIEHPITGAWTADLELIEQSALATRVKIQQDSIEWSCTKVRSSIYAGKTTARVVGGAGGLGKVAKPKSYTGTQARRIIQDLLSAVGEQLSDSSQADQLARVFDYWTTEARAVGVVLSEITDALGANWRVLRDGRVWVGVDEFPAAASFSFRELDRAPEQGLTEIASDTFALEVGTSFDGRQVTRVVHTVSDVGLRTTYWAGDSNGNVLGDVKSALVRFIRWIMRDVTYHKLYACTVQSQDTNGLLDLLPDDESIRGNGLSKVPIRHGLPGVRVEVPQGARVNLGFEDGDPRKPRAMLWHEGSVTKVIFDGGDKSVARVDDTVDIGTMTLAGQVSGSYTPPGGSPQAIPGTLTLSGKITSGNDKLQA